MTSILVVDDDLEFARSVLRQLERANMPARHADSAGTALDVLSKWRPEVVVTDLDLHDPDHDGLALMAMIRGRYRDTKTILMSAVASASDYQAALRLGATDMLCKPFSSKELVEAVTKARQCAQGYHGTLHGVHLTDLLQSFHCDRRTLSVHIVSDPVARVDILDGEFVHATCLAYSGEEALCFILSREAGAVHTSALTPGAQTIHREFNDVFRGAFQTLAEGGVLLRGNEPPAPHARIELDLWRADNANSVDQCCKALVQDNDGVMACGVVDLDARRLLGIYDDAQSGRSIHELMSSNSLGGFDEMHISARHNLCFAKTIMGDRVVVILVTSKATSQGMGWTRLRSVIPEIESLLQRGDQSLHVESPKAKTPS